MANQLKVRTCDESNNSESSDGSVGCPEKSLPSMARMRWQILSNALQSKYTIESELGSKRMFESFGLIELKSTSDDEWFECRLWDDINHTFDETVIDIRLMTEKIPIYEVLHSFDNTGNVCLWPSEEVMSYYCYKNKSLCSDKTVMELGGGMTCLCGLVTAVFSSAKEVILTDGNQRCVSNIRTIIDHNRHRFKSVVKCEQLKWGEDLRSTHLYRRIDVIFCSDCLYLDESRHLLVDTIYNLLNSTGIAIMLAPTRGNTFDSFVELAKQKFDLQVIKIYDKTVWNKHNIFVDTAKTCHYIPDLHYPIMITLRNKTC